MGSTRWSYMVWLLVWLSLSIVFVLNVLFSVITLCCVVWLSVLYCRRYIGSDIPLTNENDRFRCMNITLSVRFSISRTASPSESITILALMFPSSEICVPVAAIWQKTPTRRAETVNVMVSSADISKKNFLVIVLQFFSIIVFSCKGSRFHLAKQGRFPTYLMDFPYFQKSALYKNEDGGFSKYIIG